MVQRLDHLRRIHGVVGIVSHDVEVIRPFRRAGSDVQVP
jgi:hypothetical protein